MLMEPEAYIRIDSLHGLNPFPCFYLIHRGMYNTQLIIPGITESTLP